MCEGEQRRWGGKGRWGRGGEDSDSDAAEHQARVCDGRDAYVVCVCVCVCV